jgi:3-oxoacyl-[acyl-carrier protein] reductase
MDLGIRGRTALVAASTSGLGLASARKLAAEGANVVLSGRRGALARELAADLESAVGVEADLTDARSPRVLVDAAADRFGPVDILVLNSGGPPPGVASDVSRQALLAAMESMLLQQMELVSLVLPGMRERGWGRIAAIGSASIQRPMPDLALSSIVRAALAAYLKSLAHDVAASGVTVNLVLPGRINTDRVGALDAARAEREGTSVEATRAASIAGIPAGRYGEPEEFAAVVTFLCSAQASYVTGEQVRCDGGYVSSY